MSLTKFILDLSSEFKVMHFTSSNLLHDFPNDKNMLFSLYIKKFMRKIRSDPTRPNLQPD